MIASAHGVRKGTTTTTDDKSGVITARLAMTSTTSVRTETTMMIAIATTEIREAIGRVVLQSTRSIVAAVIRRSTDRRAPTATAAATVAASIGGAIAPDRTQQLQMISTVTTIRVHVVRTKVRKINTVSGIDLGIETGTVTGEIEKIATTTTTSTAPVTKTRRSGAVVIATKEMIASTMMTSTVLLGAAVKIVIASVTETMRGNLYQRPRHVLCRPP